MTQADNLSLDELRVALAPGVARAAVFDGWGEDAVREAAAEMGVSEDVALYAFNASEMGGGAMAMISAWIASIDLAMFQALPAEELAKLPIRERISRLVRFRLAALDGAEESLRRAQAIMARPRNLAAAARLGWQSADAMWRLAGDRAVDFNHYTKRATLAGIYAATLAVFASDESEGKADTLAFLDRRIEGVMRFEKLKGQLLRRDSMHFSPVRLLGRLRYPA